MSEYLKPEGLNLGEAIARRIQKIRVEAARELASSEDYYEMDACGETYETCKDEACIHNILLSAAAKKEGN